MAVTTGGSRPNPNLTDTPSLDLSRHGASETRASAGFWPRAWARLRRDRAAMVGLFMIIGIVAAAILAPWIAPYDPAEQFRDGLTLEGQPVPSTLLTDGSFRFVLGTDANGRDMLSRFLYGARVSLVVGVLANVIAITIGVLIGATAGYFGYPVESILMRITEIMMAFPTLLLAMTLVAILEPSIWVVIAVIGLVYWTWIARVIYGQVLSLRTREFISAANAIGATKWRVLFRHLLPQLIPTIIVWGTLGVATNVMLEASLSFLGVGVQPPTPTWGGMIQQGYTYFRTAPWLMIVPGVAIMLTVLAFNLLGDGLRDALDPSQRRA